MARILGDTGLVQSWAGTQNTALISSGSAPYEFNLDVTSPEKDATPLGTANAMEFAAGMKQWGGTISTRLSPSVLGEAGFITASGAYLANLFGYTLNLSTDVKQSTPLVGGTATGWHTFEPGLFTWDGTWTAHVDGTTVLIVPAISYSGSFRLVDATTDHTLAGTIITTGLKAQVRIGDLALSTYNFKGSGAITAAGSGSPLFPTSPVPRAAAGDLVLRAATGRTYTGSAFWESIAIDVTPDELISISIGFKGSGILTPA